MHGRMRTARAHAPVKERLYESKPRGNARGNGSYECGKYEALLPGRRRSAGRRSRRRGAQHWLKGVAGRHWCLARVTGAWRRAPEQRHRRSTARSLAAISEELARLRPLLSSGTLARSSRALRVILYHVVDSFHAKSRCYKVILGPENNRRPPYVARKF